MSLARRESVAIALFSAFACACAGGTPLLHPAHVLPRGDLRVMGGVTGQAIVGSLADDRNAAIDAYARDPSLSSSDATAKYVRGVLVQAAVPPGVAPIAGARVGTGAGTEGGVAYTGRGARLDFRKAFSNQHYALSIGAGLDAVFLLPPSSGNVLEVDFQHLDAFGFDVPVVAGWRSTGGLYQAWIGVRGGYDFVSVHLRSTAPSQGGAQESVSLGADHGYVGGLVGAAVGFHHVHVALELDATYQIVSGSLNGQHASVSGLALTPGAALLLDF